jgi:hypothetical protein
MGAQFSGNYQHYSPAISTFPEVIRRMTTALSASWNGSFTGTAKAWPAPPQLRQRTARHGQHGRHQQYSAQHVAGPDQRLRDWVPSFSSYSPSSVQVNMNDLPDGVDG